MNHHNTTRERMLKIKMNNEKNILIKHSFNEFALITVTSPVNSLRLS